MPQAQDKRPQLNPVFPSRHYHDNFWGVEHQNPELDLAMYLLGEHDVEKAEGALCILKQEFATELEFLLLVMQGAKDLEGAAGLTSRTPKVFAKNLRHLGDHFASFLLGNKAPQFIHRFFARNFSYKWLSKKEI